MKNYNLEGAFISKRDIFKMNIPRNDEKAFKVLQSFSAGMSGIEA
jgi:hypothetical protein